MKKLSLLLAFILFALSFTGCVARVPEPPAPLVTTEETTGETTFETVEDTTAETTAETTTAETTTAETTVETTTADTTEHINAEYEYGIQTEIVIDIFGEFELPETEPPVTTKADTPPTVVKPYEPYVPTGSGRAPLALMYHLILDEPFTDLHNLFVRPSELRGHIEALLEAGYTFIFADEYALSNEKTVIMSFDDGYVDNYTEMFPIIKEYNIKVTVFMIGSYIGGQGFLSEDMIREMASSGLVSFQSHTLTHPRLTSLSPDSMRYEFAESNRIIESITGREVKAICYPTGAYNDTVLSVANEYYDYGYTTVSRNSTAGYPLITLPRLRVNRGFSKSHFASLIK